MFDRFFEDPVPDMTTATARAEAGFRYMESQYGADWYKKINVETLDIARPLHCVLGQLLRQGHWELAFLGLDVATHCGFSCGLWDCLFFCEPPWVRRSFRRLTRAWKNLLLARLAKDQETSSLPASRVSLTAGSGQSFVSVS